MSGDCLDSVSWAALAAQCRNKGREFDKLGMRELCQFTFHMADGFDRLSQTVERVKRDQDKTPAA